MLNGSEIISPKLKRMLESDPRKTQGKSVILLGLFEAAQKPRLEDLKNEELLRGVEIWTLNDYQNSFEVLHKDDFFNVTRCFQIHEIFEKLLEDKKWRSIYKNWFDTVNKNNVQVVVSKPIKGVDKQINYPFKEACKLFSMHWFRSTMSYMLAMAAMEGYERVYLRRIRVGSGDELYTKQQQQLKFAIYWLTKHYNMKIDNPWGNIWDWETSEWYKTKMEKVSEVYGAPEIYGRITKKAC